MTTDTGYPVSLLLEGPLFSDELETQPQHFRREHEVESLRLVPSKSAASGVHTIYFRPEHRHWALVRLATRYRGLFEIQLHRGMSGEYQLLRQDFTSADLEFLSDIIPRPPAEYSPIVYDMLWLTATYDEYIALAKAMANRETFVLRDLLRSVSDVDRDDESFFTRFVRSHLIRPKMETTDDSHRRSNPEKADISVNRGMEYEVTDDGDEALRGIAAEHERIFEQKEFEPLLINPDLDPLEHLREHEPESPKPRLSVEIEEVEDEAGILGEIAESFAPLEDELDSATELPETTQNTGDIESTTTETSESTTGTREAAATAGDRTAAGTASNAGDHVHRPSGGSESRRDGRSTEDGAPSLEESTDSRSDGADTDEPMVGDFTRAEVVDAAIAAATMIDDANLVRTSAVKTTVWESVELADRNRNDLWEAVRDVLIAMDDVHGRAGGHIWTASTFD
ncbi:hypothetical protein [Natrinema caseinilyticum]|uniref:hypothetical protein n=1 Tax=Natrinema caseinilyticum TaxID=2961570 RepID=UPI0020C3F050|nr:hypothetical protein [Natrinema caseinilyticum]